MSPAALVIGPVGIERHVLVSSLQTDTSAGHSVARYLLDEIELLGGSGYFAAAALIAEGIDVQLVTNTGDSEDVRRRLRVELPSVGLHDDGTGASNSYLSMWDTAGGKQLYVRSGPDPISTAVRIAKIHSEIPVIGLSLRDPGSYVILSEMEHASSRVYIAPNQTLLHHRNEFSRVARAVAVITLSESEARTAADGGTVADIAAWYQDLEPQARLIVTHGAHRITIIDSSSFSQLDLPADPRYTRVLGGGDMFAAFTAVLWDPDAPNLGIQAAASATMRRIPQSLIFE